MPSALLRTATCLASLALTLVRGNDYLSLSAIPPYFLRLLGAATVVVVVVVRSGERNKRAGKALDGGRGKRTTATGY